MVNLFYILGVIGFLILKVLIFCVVFLVLIDIGVNVKWGIYEVIWVLYILLIWELICFYL